MRLHLFSFSVLLFLIDTTAVAETLLFLISFLFIHLALALYILASRVHLIKAGLEGKREGGW